MERLRSIVYTSTADPVPGEPQLEELLVEARRLNLESGVTGVLLYCEGSFMQCFEGELQAVEETYERIRKSRRHKGLIELMSQPIAARAFPDWQMGYARVSRSELLRLSTQAWQRQVEQAALPAPGDHAAAGLDVLRDFWRRC